MSRILFFRTSRNTIAAIQADRELSAEDISKLEWFVDGQLLPPDQPIRGAFVGPRREMITPFSTNAVDSVRSFGVGAVSRIEEFQIAEPNPDLDPMLQWLYGELNQDIFKIDVSPEPIREITDIGAYNKSEGLALSLEMVKYLEDLAVKLGRPLTDSELFGFGQANSEHCRHNRFNGTYIIDGETMPETLFELIKKTTAVNPNDVVSAYKDNVAFFEGPDIFQFAPTGENGKLEIRRISTVLSLKAETHNYPTAVAGFPGATTGTGGEIRDRMGGGKGSKPTGGSADYMVSYPSTQRKWLYQSPTEILIRASDGASDFGNKFGQPLINGSLLTFDHEENGKKWGYDKPIMMAGGVGYANADHALKHPEEIKKGQRVILLGGDNYRIGMGGGAVASLDTGASATHIELNAVQRGNPEMQKRVYNVIRTMIESTDNPIISIHDHGAGGHFNCLFELLESMGGHIDMSKLPVGDPTLSAREIIGNESQERMAILVDEKDVPRVMEIAAREQCPAYNIGYITGDMRVVFEDKNKARPIDMAVKDFLGNPPKPTIVDNTVKESFAPFEYSPKGPLLPQLEKVFSLEGVGSKDFLTSKVDRSVTGLVAVQQTAGELQLPLSDYGIIHLDYDSFKGISTAIGHAPIAALIDPAKGSRLAIAEALTNSIFAPLENGLKSIKFKEFDEFLRNVYLSANWMWPCKNPGEDARLYKAVKAVGDFAIALGINIPTGKDSLSMTQQYPDGTKVLAPGTLIVSAVGAVADSRLAVSPVMKQSPGSNLFKIDMSCDELKLGGSALAQANRKVGNDAPDVKDPAYFAKVFEFIQSMARKKKILAGHDVSSGGLITTLLEMCFANQTGGLQLFIEDDNNDVVKTMFAENPAVVVQVAGGDDTTEFIKAAKEQGINLMHVGHPVQGRDFKLTYNNEKYDIKDADIDGLREIWAKPSHKLDAQQTAPDEMRTKINTFGRQPLKIDYPRRRVAVHGNARVNAAVVRAPGTNGEREMEDALYLAGFDVYDTPMYALTSGARDLSQMNMLVFPGGFANSDVCGAGQSWAGSFKYNPNAKKAFDDFCARPNTLLLGVCNGCQLGAKLLGGASLERNKSGRFESHFLSVEIPKNNSVMLGNMEGMQLGIWVAHGEGRFKLPKNSEWQTVLTYSYNEYPGNPNGSPDAIAGITNANGRHLLMMPHPERAILPHQWAHRPLPAWSLTDVDGKTHSVMPWQQMFLNAREWILQHQK